MAIKDASKIFAVLGGQILWADKSAEFPTTANYTFNKTVWHDLGAIKNQPKLSTDLSTTTVELWNMDDVIIGSKKSYTLNFGSAQLDWENAKMFFNFDEVDEDGGFVPGETEWAGQIAIILVTTNGNGLFHAPSTTYSAKGDWDMVKNDAAVLDSTLALNYNSKLGGAFRFVPPTALVPETSTPAS